jgi:hypothetical protein
MSENDVKHFYNHGSFPFRLMRSLEDYIRVDIKLVVGFPDGTEKTYNAYARLTRCASWAELVDVLREELSYVYEKDLGLELGTSVDNFNHVEVEETFVEDMSSSIIHNGEEYGKLHKREMCLGLRSELEIKVHVDSAVGL